MTASNTQSPQKLKAKNIITKYNEYDVRFLSELLKSGAIKTGKIEKDNFGICHHKLRNQPYLLLDGVELSPAINCAKDIEEDNSVENCICGGEFEEEDIVLICSRCGALHSDFE